MKIFDFTLNIKQGQMTCVNCSKTISNALTHFFAEKSLNTVIATNYRQNQIRFSLMLNSQEEAHSIVSECQPVLTGVGFDYESYQINNSAIIDSKTVIFNSNKSATSNREILFSIPLILSGIFLMLAEHFELIPSVSSIYGLGAQTGIGIMTSIISGLAGKNHLKNAWRHRCAPSQGAMDSLIVLGCVSAILYSFFKIFTFSIFNNKEKMTFFDVPLVTLGSLKLSHGIRDKLHAQIEENLDLIQDSKENLPKCVPTCWEDDIKKIIDKPELKAHQLNLENSYVHEIDIGSIICVDPNEIVPIDGIIILPIEYEVQESFYGKKGLTLKKMNGVVYAGSINKTDKPMLLKTICQVEDNHIRKAYASVNMNKSNSKINLEKISQYFFRSVLGIALGSATGWFIWGPAPSDQYAAQVFLSVMLSACPCTLGLIDIGASVTKLIAFNYGILIEKDRVLSIDQCTDVCFDKCGTLTTGEYKFKEIASIDNSLSQQDQQKYLKYAAILESQIDKKDRSAVGRAILETRNEFKSDLEIKDKVCTEFSDNIFNQGRGGYAKIDGHQVVVGNIRLLKHYQVDVSQDWQKLALKYTTRSELPIFLAIDGKLACLLIFESQLEEKQLLRPFTREVIEWLVKNNKNIHFLTGDSKERTQILLEQFPNCKIQIESEQTPLSKVERIQKLQQSGRLVAMIGDDKNDAGAIRQADYGLAIDTTAQIRDKADAVLNGSLKSLCQLMRLAKINRRGYQLSLLWAFGLNSLTILTASGIFYPQTHRLLNPMITSATMAFSSTILLLNIGLFNILGRCVMKKIDRQLTQKIQRDPLRRPLLLSFSENNPISSNETPHLSLNFAIDIET